MLALLSTCQSTTLQLAVLHWTLHRSRQLSIPPEPPAFLRALSSPTQTSLRRLRVHVRLLAISLTRLIHDYSSSFRSRMFLHASLCTSCFLERVSLDSRQILRICCPTFRLLSPLFCSSYRVCSKRSTTPLPRKPAAESRARCSHGVPSRLAHMRSHKSVLSDLLY